MFSRHIWWIRKEVGEVQISPLIVNVASFDSGNNMMWEMNNIYLKVPEFHSNWRLLSTQWHKFKWELNTINLMVPIGMGNNRSIDHSHFLSPNNTILVHNHGVLKRSSGMISCGLGLLYRSFHCFPVRFPSLPLHLPSSQVHIPVSTMVFHIPLTSFHFPCLPFDFSSLSFSFSPHVEQPPLLVDRRGHHLLDWRFS